MSQNKPTLSVVVVNWNTGSTTCRCLRSVAKFLSSLRPQIIVVDNGSTDNSLQLFHQLKIPRLQIIANPRNDGFSKGNNLGALEASGDYLFFLNSDMIIPDSSFVKMFDYHLSSKSGITAPRFLNPDFTPQASVFPSQSIVNAIREFWLNQNHAFTKYIPASHSPTSVWAVSGGAMLISQKLFRKIGRWDEKFFMYYEDLDLCSKVRSLGLPVIYYPHCTVIHHHGLSGRSLSDSANQWRRLIPGSIKFHGIIKHYILFLILWSSQKLKNPPSP